MNQVAHGIKEIQDYAALSKLATALWRRGGSFHGAAVMVGSGFSRTAATSGDTRRRLPLWGDLCQTLARELGATGAQDPLRLAEEYRAYFGKQVLQDLLKREVSDSAWKPGDLHKDLLSLPWSEVLTTNWDTLLERSSLSLYKPVYSIVNNQSDLASAHSPRIVKLHGTIDVSNDLVFSQEDYRRYPQEFAAFVNFARQTFIENELCLLGFSGEDPNFLQWAGWVRDHLTTDARRIYLVGALDLTAAKRKYLESLNVAPIDLSSLVRQFDTPDARHFHATAIFIEALRSLKPEPEWRWKPVRLHRDTIDEGEIAGPGPSPVLLAKRLESQIGILKKDRLSYPGWIVCPWEIRLTLQSQVSDPYPTEAIFNEISGDLQGAFLYEYVWRLRKTFQIAPVWICRAIVRLCELGAGNTGLSKKQKMEMALFVLTTSRWSKAAEMAPLSANARKFLEGGVDEWQDVSEELVFFDAACARDSLSYGSLQRLARSVEPRGALGKMKKAGLLAELGLLEESTSLFTAAFQQLQDQFRNDQESVLLQSSLAWAHWLVRGINVFNPGVKYERFPFEYDEAKCNPATETNHLSERASKAVEEQNKRKSIEVSFRPGHYKDHSKGLHFSGELHSRLLLDGIETATGMPLRSHGVGFLADAARRVCILEDIDFLDAASLAMRAASSDKDEALNHLFSRSRIACVDKEVIDVLLKQVTEAIAYWSNASSASMDGFYAGRLRVLFEVMARLAVRCDPEQAAVIVRLGCSLAAKAELQHVWLSDSLRNLIDYGIESVPYSHRSGLLNDVLSFPLPGETVLKDWDQWPNPIIRKVVDRPLSSAIDRRIDQLIELVGSDPKTSAKVLLRLLPLLDEGLLTEDERTKLKVKLWGDSPDYRSLPATGLLIHALAAMPADDSSAVDKLVRQHLFDVESTRFLKLEHLVDVANAGASGLLPNSDQAYLHFEALVAWRPKVTDPAYAFAGLGNDDESMGRMVCDALRWSIVPALGDEQKGEDAYERICKLQDEGRLPEAVAALPAIVTAMPQLSRRFEKLVRRLLNSRDPVVAGWAAVALLRWRELTDAPECGRLIDLLVNRIEIHEIRGLDGLLSTLQRMLRQGLLSDQNIETLSESLPSIFASVEFSAVQHGSRDAIVCSLVRAECAKVAQEIITRVSEPGEELKHILQAAADDPLPEVRFAVTGRS